MKLNPTPAESLSDTAYERALEVLDQRLRSLPGAVVAFSGGADSAMLVHASQRILDDRVLAVTARSPSLPAIELAEAEAFCKGHGIRHMVIDTHELDRSGYRRNSSDRCYFCKTELFEAMAEHLEGLGEADWPVLFGAITDDAGDHRPGARAARERGVLAPLADSGISKVGVRRYSAEHGLETADKPSFACLASRIPYGTPVDSDTLRRLEQAEDLLRELGFSQFRVRHHGAIARVELLPTDLLRAVGDHREPIVQGFRDLGYAYVTLDLAGYRSGSMNEVL